MTDCLSWIKNLFVNYDGIQSGTAEGSALFTHPLIFTIMGISLVTLILEELVGVLTSFRFGGFFFRRFGRGYGSGYRTKYETEFPKSYDVDYSFETAKPFKSRYGVRYFISYNGKYYPFRHSRYNPFYARQFNVAYREGRISTASEIYGQKSNVFNSHSNSSYSSYSSAYNADGIGRTIKQGFNVFEKLKKAYDKHKRDKQNEEDRAEFEKWDLARQQDEENQFNENADWESLQANESSSASYDGPRPSDLDVSVDDD